MNVSETMQAAVLFDFGDLRITEVPVPKLGMGEVLVKVAHCGVCHSDLSVIDGAVPAQLPVVLGHEAAGRVEAVGENVTSVAVGDPVVLTPCPPCGPSGSGGWGRPDAWGRRQGGRPYTS